MKLTSSCIYGYLKEDSTIYLSSHAETPTGGTSAFGVFKVLENGNDLDVVRVSYASQIDYPYVGFTPNGVFGNIISLSSFLFIPYYQRTGSNSYDVILKYAKNDLYLLRQVTVQSQTIQATHQGIFAPVLTEVNNLLYYLIDDIIYIYEPNNLQKVGTITIDNNFEGRGISSFKRGAVSYLFIVGNYVGTPDTQYVLFLRADNIGQDKFGKTVAITSIDSEDSLSIFSSDKLGAIESRSFLYG